MGSRSIRHLDRGAMAGGSVIGLILVVGLTGLVWGQESRSLLQTIQTLIISPDGGSEDTVVHQVNGSTPDDPINIPTGALRDGSVVADDIDRSMVGTDMNLSCDTGQVIVGLSGNEISCASVDTDTLRQSDDAGTSSIYYGTLSSARVYVGEEPNIAYFLDNEGFDQGLYTDGDFVSTEEVRVDEGLRLIAPGVQLADDVLAPGASAIPSNPAPHAIMAQTRPLVIGEREVVGSFGSTPPPAVGIATMTPQAGVDVAGDVIVDGRQYIMRHETTPADLNDDAVARLTTLSSGQHRWMATRPSTVIDTGGQPQSRIQIDTPQLAIGYAADGIPAADTRLDVDGRASLWHASGDAPVYLDDLRHDSAAVSDLDPTSSVPEECVALSLDDDGHVVLVNVCAE